MKGLYIVCKKKASDQIIIFKKEDVPGELYERILWYENYRRINARESKPNDRQLFGYGPILEDEKNAYDFTFYNDTNKLIVDYFWLFLL